MLSLLKLTVKQLVIWSQRNVHTLVSYGATHHAYCSAYPRDVLYEKGEDILTKWIELL